MGESTAGSAISPSKAGCRLYVPAVRDVRELALSHFGLREIAWARPVVMLPRSMARGVSSLPRRS